MSAAGTSAPVSRANRIAVAPTPQPMSSTRLASCAYARSWSVEIRSPGWIISLATGLEDPEKVMVAFLVASARPNWADRP